MSKIIINGHSFTVEGALSMRNGKWYDGAGHEIDMNNLSETKESKTINITIEGNVERLDIDCCNTVTVNGNVRKVDTGSGSVSCRVIEGDADTGSGSVHCDTIMGDADTGSGNIYCNKIGGKKRTGSGHIYEDGIQQAKTEWNSRPSTTITCGDVISGGVTMIRTADGKKHMTLNKDCSVNGRRIGDMSQEEIRKMIDDMAKKNKIVTII